MGIQNCGGFRAYMRCLAFYHVMPCGFAGVVWMGRGKEECESKDSQPTSVNFMLT